VELTGVRRVLPTRRFASWTARLIERTMLLRNVLRSLRRVCADGNSAHVGKVSHACDTCLEGASRVLLLDAEGSARAYEAPRTRVRCFGYTPAVAARYAISKVRCLAEGEKRR